MNTEQLYTPKYPEQLTDQQVEDSKKVNVLLQEIAELGAINLISIPVDEYDDFVDNFLNEYKGKEDELRLSSVHREPVYSDTGSEVVAYQVYTHADTSHFSPEQTKQLEQIDSQGIGLSRILSK